MAPIIDSRQSGTSSAGASTLSWSHTVGSNSEPILLVEGGNASGSGFVISGVEWDFGGTPVALTNKGHQSDGGSNAWADIWYRLAPEQGTKTIKITYTGTTSCTSGSSSYLGVDQTTPFNAASPQGANGTGSTASVNVTSDDEELVVDAMVDNLLGADPTLVVGAGQTTIHNIVVSGNVGGASSDEAGAASVTMEWTGLQAADTWGIVGVSIRASGLPNIIRDRKLSTQQRMVA